MQPRNAWDQNDQAGMFGQEGQVCPHVLRPLRQTLRLVGVDILELNDEQHGRLPSLA